MQSSKRISTAFRILGRLGFVFLFCNIVFAQPPETLWMREFGQELGFMTVRNINATPDGGAVIAVTANDRYESFLVKYDSSGNQLWNVPTFINNQVGGINVVAWVAQTGDGHFLCNGFGYLNENAEFDRAVTILYTADGDTVWRREFDTLQTFGGSTGFGCFEREDGTFIIAGAGRRDQDILRPPIPFVVCYSTDGELLWDQYYYEDERQNTSSLTLFPLVEGGIGVTTYTDFWHQDPRYRVWTLGDSGAIEQEIDLFALGIWPSSIFPIYPNNVMYGGYMCRAANQTLVRLNAEFEVEWTDSTTFAWLDNGIGIWCPYMDSDFLAGSETQIHNGFGIFKSFLFRVNESREVVWTKQFLDPDSTVDYLTPVATVLTDGSICAAMSKDYPDSYIAVVRLARDTIQTAIDGQQPTVPDQFEILAFPNPFNSTLSISLDVPLHQDVTVALYDLLGREVDVLQHGRLASTTLNYTAPSTLASGIYFLRASTATQTAMRKVVLLK